MIISLKNIGKKFNKDWLFRNLNYTFNINESYAITGLNGSGKSTLLQIISGFVMPTEGELEIAELETKNDKQKTIINIFLIIIRSGHQK